MDALKKGLDKVKGGNDKSAEGASAGGAASGQQEQGGDYVDKAFSAGVKKSGYDISPENQEKITDAGREGFEKMSGKQVPSKFSN